MAKVLKEDYAKIAKVYNESGNKAAMEYITNIYGTKSPRGVLMRIKKSPGFSYDEKSQKIIIKSKEESLFMGIDELCSKPYPREIPPAIVHNKYSQIDNTLDALYKELLQEKLVELTKYIKLNRVANTIYIDKTTLLADGYNMTIF